jgi:hypothetical protein
MAQRLRAAVVGDSVVWGQGHPQAGKFYAMAFAALRDRGVLDVVVPDGLFTAQSGAQASNVDNRFAFILGSQPSAAVSPRNGISGEIPSSAPSARDQLRAIHPRAAEVDVLVMDGGANDLGFINAAIPFDGSQDGVVADATRHIADAARREGLDAKEYFFSTYFTTRLGSVSLALADTQPLRARHVFYTGYYPGLSQDSATDEVAGLLAAGLMFGPATALLGPLGIAVSVIVGFKAAEEARQAAAQVEYFYARLTAEITRRIAEHNTRNRASVHYVNPRFPPSRAMYTGEPWIYEPTDGGNAQIRQDRIAHYKARMGKDPSFKTANAHIAHPNVAGAQHYAKRLAEEMERVVNFSLRREAGRISAEPGVAARLRRLYGFSNGGSLRSLLRLAVVETVEFVYRFKHTVAVFDGDADDHFLVAPVRLSTAAGDFNGRAFRTQRHLEVLFDLRGVEYRRLGALTFVFEGFNLLRDREGTLDLYINGYRLSGEPLGPKNPLSPKDWPAAPGRSGSYRYVHPLD